MSSAIIYTARPEGGYSSLASVAAVGGLPSIDWDVVAGWGD